MKIYLKKTVWEAALERMRYIFKEFPNVIIGISGGKDSTVIFQLALIVAKEMGRLPLKVFFLDQEAEWDCVIDHVRSIMYRPEVFPMWYQMPIRLFNATSPNSPWLYCWDEEKAGDWIREKDPISIKENNYGTDRFHEIFGAIFAKDYPQTKTCYLAGVRCEESPQRMIGLTSNPTYKFITYGKILSKKLQHYTFYPIYDWSLSDVWHAIEINKWEYCKLYDYMYQFGVDPNHMRVSNVHHETAVHSLFFLQEIEPDTWERITRRLAGISTAGQLGKHDYFVGVTLPFMFRDWKEYRDYLLEHLITDDHKKMIFRRKFEKMDEVYEGMNNPDILYRAHINTLLANDFEFTKLQAFERRPAAMVYRKWSKDHNYQVRKNEHGKFIPEAYRNIPSSDQR